MAALGYYAVYGLTVIAVLVASKRETLPTKTSFDLGRLAGPVRIAALVWCVLVVLCLTVPELNHQTALTAGVFFVLAGIWYAVILRSRINQYAGRRTPGRYRPVSQTVDRFVKQGFRSAAPYNAEHHDFAWQHRQLARMMSNECPMPPSPRVSGRRSGKRFDIGQPLPLFGQRSCVAASAAVQLRADRSRSSWATVRRRCWTSWSPGCWSVPATRRSSPSPTYAFFESQTRLSTAAFRKPVPLTRRRGSLDIEAMLGAGHRPRTKIIFLCSPNNPTGKGWRRDRAGCGCSTPGMPGRGRPGVPGVRPRRIVRAPRRPTTRTSS